MRVALLERRRLPGQAWQDREVHQRGGVWVGGWGLGGGDPCLQIAMRDFTGPGDIWPTRQAWRPGGRIVMRHTGPETVLCEVDGAAAIVMWVEAVDAQRGGSGRIHQQQKLIMCIQ